MVAAADIYIHIREQSTSETVERFEPYESRRCSPYSAFTDLFGTCEIFGEWRGPVDAWFVQWRNGGLSLGCGPVQLQVCPTRRGKVIAIFLAVVSIVAMYRAGVG